MQGRQAPKRNLGNIMVSIPLSRFIQFKKQHPELRFGQEFHQYMNFDKCIQDKDWLDKLYNAPDHIALSMIRSVLDIQN
jgi:hypothetical protein